MASVLTTHLAGRGPDVVALRALPTETPAPGVLLVHDAWGLDEEAADLAAALADAGFAPLAPDLLRGRRAADAGTAAALAAGLDPEDAALLLASAVDALTADPATAPGPIAAVGLGMGAPLAAFMATVRPEIAAAVLVGSLPDLPLEAWGRADARFALLVPAEDGADGADDEPGVHDPRPAHAAAAEGATAEGSADRRNDAPVRAAAEEAATTLRAAGLVVEVHALVASDDVAAAVAARLRATWAALG